METRKHVVGTAGYWFNAARTAQNEGKMSMALLCMENAYNHTENALVAARDALQALKDAVEKYGKMNGDEYKSLGIQVNKALVHLEH